MKIDNLLKIASKKLNLPKSIEEGIISLFNVSDIKNIDEKTKSNIYNIHESFFEDKTTISYDNTPKEYTIFYLPVNMYKVWSPLIDLLEKSQIKRKCSILELGSGPGSSTFGVLEFYRYLSLENQDLIFELSIDLVEKERNFILIFEKIFEYYKKDIPSNLIIKINKYNMAFAEFIKDYINKQYDFIIESNMLNPNENIDEEEYIMLSNNIKNYLKPNSSIILIEPAKKILSDKLRFLKEKLEERGLSTYSPCSCIFKSCKQFPIACVDISGIDFLSKLRDYGFISKNKIKNKHSYEYIVLRNDELKKYNLISNSLKLSDLQNNIGKHVNFKAYILYFGDFGDSYNIKICDGSLCDNEVWLKIPKTIFESNGLDTSNMGRGGIINVKRAKVENKRNIICCLATGVGLER